MALKPLQAQLPLGQFDGLDTEFTTLKGGEVVGLVGSVLGADKAAADLNDGYVGTTVKRRPVVTKSLTTGMRPLWLSDDGTTGYGTLFGTVVGGTAGQVVTGGASLGPHTATGSGKVTCWAMPGLYAVSLDAVDTNATTGLAPSNSTLTVGAALYATSAGLLTPNAASSFEGALVVARLIEFTTSGSLVTTPNNLVSAANSPSGNAAADLLKFTEAVISFQGVDG